MPMTKEQRATVKELYALGLTTPKMSEVIGVPAETIYSYLSATKWYRLVNGPKSWTQEEKVKIRELYLEGYTSTQIAKEVGRNLNKVYRYLRTTDYYDPDRGNYTDKNGIYRSLPKKYPQHYHAWRFMWTSGVEIDQVFTRNYEGFKRFVEYMGPVPEGMVRPTRGRIDHRVGYMIGNFGWQEFRENTLEALSRAHARRRSCHSCNHV